MITPMPIEMLLKSCTHALAQIESLQLGCSERSDRLTAAKVSLDEVYGTDAGRTVALACAHGAEGDAATALGKAAEALRQEIGHLQAITT